MILILCLNFLSDKPGAPGVPELSEITDSSIRLDWTPPENDGGAPILGYHVEYKLADTTRWTTASVDRITDTNLIVRRLKMDSEYEFRVCAENKVGSGAFSKSTEIVKIKAPLGECWLQTVDYSFDPRLEQTTSSAHIFSKATVWMEKYLKKSCSY
jgi:titin